MAHVKKRDGRIFQILVNRRNMPAAQGKDVIHAPVDQGIRNELTSNNVFHNISS